MYIRVLLTQKSEQPIEAISELCIRQVLSQAILIARAASALPRCAAFGNAHLQTLLPRLLRRRVTLRPHWQRLDLPDGDFLDLAWSEAPEQARHKPRLVVFHGLEGSLHSPYAHGLIQAAKARGWLGVVMHFRGCSGEPNRQKRIYHSGETEDGTWFLHWLRGKSFGTVPTAAVGYSLGGNMLACLLGKGATASRWMLR